MGDSSRLTPEQENEIWRKTAAQIRSLVDALSGRLPSDDASAVLDFLEHNEVGVALEHLVDAVSEERVSISQQELTQFTDLFAGMRLSRGRQAIRTASPRIALGRAA